MKVFNRSEDAQHIYLDCARCGARLTFSRSARPEEIERAKAEHRCTRAADLAA